MKTDDLIQMLATGAGPAPTWPAAPKLLASAGLGVVGASLLALMALGPIPAALWATPAPWIKIGYGLLLALAAGWLAARRARPLAPEAGARRSVILVFAAIAMVGTLSLLATPAEQRMADLKGHSWTFCPFNVLACALPALAATLWSVRQLAPSSPRAAGLAAGLMSGAVGATGYALACTETAPIFVTVWYTLGIAMTAALGAVLGPRVLRW